MITYIYIYIYFLAGDGMRDGAGVYSSALLGPRGAGARSHPHHCQTFYGDKSLLLEKWTEDIRMSTEYEVSQSIPQTKTQLKNRSTSIIAAKKN